jgi:hypothetical protein
MATCNAEQYADICDVVERTYHGWPLDHDEANPWNHTSKEARAATNRILEILRVAILEEEEEPQRAYLAGRVEGLAGTTRYNLTDEDRAVLRDVAGLLKDSGDKS